MIDGEDAAAGLVAAGCRIWTADGALPAEYLAPGDRIVTRGRGYVRLVEAAAVSLRIDAVEVAPGALGRGRPEAPVIVPAGQALLLRGSGRQAAAPAGCLAGWPGLRALGLRELRLVRLRLETAETLYAEGLELPVPGSAARLQAA